MVDPPATRECAWFTPPMNRFRCTARGASLVVALLMCLGVLLPSLPTIASEVPSAVATTADSPRLDQETNGDGTPLDETYLLAPAEEAEDAAKHPPNAELLTMLVLTVCFGSGVGWPLGDARRRGGSCSLALVGRWFGLSLDELPSLLGVFRL
jgi:hypothetical protein